MPTKLDVELTTTKWLRDYIVLQASDAGILYQHHYYFQPVLRGDYTMMGATNTHLTHWLTYTCASVYLLTTKQRLVVRDPPASCRPPPPL